MMRCILCNQEMEFLTDNLRNGEKGEIYYCRHCDFARLLPKDEISYNSYRKTHGPTIGKETDIQKLFDIECRNQWRRLRILRRYLDRSKSLLDVGCGVGAFLWNIKGKVSVAIGVEPNKREAEYAEEKTGYKVIHGTIDDVPEEEAFDIITMFQTLEHIEDPVAYLIKVKQHLKPDGTIIIEVPNLHDALKDLYKIPSYETFYFHKYHYNYFSKQSLRLLLRRVGLEGRIYYTQDYNVFNHIHWIIEKQPQESCEIGLWEISIRRWLNINPLEKNYMLDEVERLFKEFNRNYEELLIKFGMTSNLTFIGRNCGK